MGAVNFITGAGGFLQTFIFGYAGFRLHVENLKFNGYFPLPPDSTYLYLHNVKYLGYGLNFNFTATGIQLKIVKLSSDYSLEIIMKDKTVDLNKGNLEFDRYCSKFNLLSFLFLFKLVLS